LATGDAIGPTAIRRAHCEAAAAPIIFIFNEHGEGF
jgi:hypothetical protein